MKILLIGNYSADKQYSMQGFTGALLSGMRDRGQKVRVLAARPILGHVGSREGLGKWLGYADKYLFFPPELERASRWADVVHVCDQGNAIYMRYLQNVPNLLTCHDLLTMRACLGELPEWSWSTGRTGHIYQNLILEGLKKAKHIICDSEATRQDTLRLTQLSPEKVRHTYISLLQSYRSMPASQAKPLLEEIGVSPGPYFFHVGGNQPYKNRIMVLEIYRAIRHETGMSGHKLVMAGKPFTEKLRDYVAAHGLSDHVLERPDLNHDQLNALYSMAACLIFPSLNEGFGLPVIEAQASGCPVFTSNRAPMTEVGGDGAVYIDPLRPTDAALTITAGLANRERMVQAGFENVRRFAPDIMLDSYLQEYRRIANGSLHDRS